MKVCLVGEGAQATVHLDVLKRIDDVQIVSLAGGVRVVAEAFALRHGIPHVSTDLEECLEQPGVEAVVITSPTQRHCEQAVLALDRGKHVLIELPMGLSLAEAQQVVEAESDGFDSYWAPQVAGTDAFTLLALAGARTRGLLKSLVGKL